MREKYIEMVEALSLAASNLHKAPTMNEMLASLRNSVYKPGAAGAAMFKSLAVSDLISSINHINQFIDVEQLPFDEPSMKANIIRSAKSMKEDQERNIEKLDHLANNMVGLSSDGGLTNIREAIERVLDDIIQSSQEISR